MKIISQHRVLVAFAVAGLAVAAAQAQSGAPEAVWQWHPAETVGEAVPPLPPPSTYPVQLVLDDDSSDGAFGVAGQTARQFLWFNRFSPAAGFHLDEVWVLFPSGANMTAGGAVQIAIYEDPDGDPTNGANLVTTFNATIQAADDNTFSIYPVAGSPVIPSGSDLLVGVVPRFIVSGVTPPTFPAAVDTTASQNRSWVAAWSTDPPDPPVLVPVPDQTLALVDTFVPGGGNFMIRAFGTPQPVTEVPTLGELGLATLAVALLGAGLLVLRRRTAATTLALAALLLSAAAPATAVTIDSFTTNQAAVSDPPGAGSSVTGGADIIGTRRGLVPDLLVGAGPASASVAGGTLLFQVTATTPDSRGAVAVSWDGDTNAAVLSPTGLGGQNLTVSNHSGFRILVNSASAGTELELTVYSNATDYSSAARRLPAIAAPTSILIPYTEFRSASGTGATFSSVGAIVMTVRGTEVNATFDLVETSAAVVAATKVDTQIVDTDGDTRVDPGDRVRYTVTVTNTGNEALAVDLSDTVDANTTLVAGSVSSTPVAHNDQYGWFGNVTFSSDGSATKPNLLDNDEDADGDTLAVQSGSFPGATVLGGTVTLTSAATGAFTYNPPVGTSGVDSFNYTVIDDNGNTSTATVYIALKGVVWFVDDSNITPPALGTFADPFQSLAAVNGAGDADQPGDTIFVYDDDGTPYAGGLVLEADQTLLGEAAGLVLDGTTIVPVGGRPQITNAAGNGLTLATNNTLAGFDIQGTSAFGITGSTFGTLTASNVNVLATGTDALNLQTGDLAATFGTLSSAGTAPGRGLAFFAVTGSLTATTTSLTNPTIDGIVVSGSPGVSLDFGTTTITDNAIGSGATANGVNFNSSAGASMTFSSLAVTSDGGTGLRAIQGTINIGGTGNSIVSTGGPAVDANSTSFGSGATFATLSSTNSPGKGINLDTITGPFTANGGAISNATGTCFDLNGGAGNVTYSGPITCTANALLVEITGRTGGTVTLSGNLSSTSAGNGINVSSNTGGTINFSGATKTLNTGADAAVTLATNTGATINFTGGGLDIDTTSGAGFNATGGAAGISVQGSGNSIASGTGTALNVANTTIAASGLTFQSISSNGAASGIVLSATGSSGGLTVTGNSSGLCGGSVASVPPGTAASTTAPVTSDCTGGTIQASTGPGISLAGTSNVSLARMRVLNGLDDGIQGTNVTGFQLTSSLLDNNGNALNENNIDFGGNSDTAPDGLRGAGSVTNSTLRDGYDRGLSVRNINGAALTSFNVTGSQFRGRAAENNNNDGLLLEALGTASITANISGSYFAANKGDHFQAAGVNSGSLNVTFYNNTLTGGHSTALGQGITINAATGVAFGGWTGQITYDVDGNNITGAISNGVTVAQGTSGASGGFTGKVRNNVIGTSGASLSCSTQANGVYIDARGNGTHTSAVTNNTIRQCFDRGILSEAGDGDSVLNLTVTGNTIDQQVDVNAREAIQTNYGITSTNVFGNVDTNNVCLQLGGAGALANTFSHGGGAPDDFRLRKRQEATVRLPGYSGGTGQDATSLAQVVAFIQGQNTGSAGEPGSAAASGAGGGYTGGAACPTPP